MQPPRRAKAAAKPIQDYDDLTDIESDADQEMQTVGDFYADNGAQDMIQNESEASDYERKTSKKRSKKQIQPSKKRKLLEEPLPEVPEMSDLDSEEDREDDLRLFERKQVEPAVKATVTSKVLKLEIRSAPTIINIDLTRLFPALQDSRNSKAGSVSDFEGSTLVDTEEEIRNSTSNGPESMRLNNEYACFLELEPELRNGIYRELLLDTDVISFNPCPRSKRQSAILRTCHQIHEEARGILYGENAFHFERTHKDRGRYYDREFREVGYKDIRRFLETIGPINLAKMRFLSIHLEDAIPTFTPKLEISERRFVNDPILHYVLQLIGNSGCVLEKFTVFFGGKAMVTTDDVAFVRAFTTIRCRKLIKARPQWRIARCSESLWRQMEKFMEMPMLANVDTQRQRVPKMKYE